MFAARYSRALVFIRIYCDVAVASQPAPRKAPIYLGAVVRGCGRGCRRRRLLGQLLILERPAILVDEVLHLHAPVLRERLVLAHRREAALLLVAVEHLVTGLEQLLVVRHAL